MKKLTVLALASLFSAAAIAAPVGETFTGIGAGVDLTSTKYKGGKQATSGAVFVDYGIDQGNNLVGVIEGKIKPHNSKVAEENGYKVEEKGHIAASYAQGYRVTPDLLPYAKVSYQVARYKKEGATDTTSYSESSTKGGLGYGAGVKYAVSSNFEVGAEYQRTNVKFDSSRKNANNFSATAGYRF